MSVSTATFSVEQKPNIIIIMTDDQGYGDMPVHGSLDVHTPPMDRLKSQTVSLECFHVSPTCTPSRVEIMSSSVPFKCGVTHAIWEVAYGR